MAGDYTRHSFDPKKGYSGVHKQQGRVSIEADHNEFERILDRRRRVETIDTIGLGVIPIITPDGFKIGLTGGALTIGPGRAYVDGIQVECLGTPPPAASVYDEHVGEDHGTTPLPYAQQPFIYAPSFPALSPPVATDLVYLDVWQREVSVLEDEELLEPALNGPDTTTRIQSAWQVKVLQSPGATTCADLPAAWLNLIAPSTGRLTANAAPGAPSPQPCVIDPAGGYTGLENRFYRVEVHRAGLLNPAAPGAPPGAVQATFKWSRDNATLAARVLSIVAGPLAGQSTITVRSTGRDRFLRFEINDHIELLDDHVEFALRDSGVGGSIARIVNVDYANSRITVDQNLSGFAVVSARHPRIRRWDVDRDASPAQAPVRNAVPGVAIALEHGITITFDNNPLATLHAGDYWVFAARTSTGALLDPPISAPPVGILHHFMKLALVTTSATPVILDCREFWPPQGGCCTAVVKPGQSIQAAIDKLPATGGCVCLKTGLHIITAPIRMTRSNICLHGETLGAVVRFPNGETLVEIGTLTGAQIQNLCLEHIRFESGTDVAGRGALVRIENARDVGVCECEFAPGPGGTAAAIAIVTNNATAITIDHNEVRGLMAGVLCMNSSQLKITDNVLVSTFVMVQGPLDPFPIAISMGVFAIRLADDCATGNAIERNQMVDYRFGVYVGTNAEHTAVEANRITRQGRFDAGSLEPTELVVGGAIGTVDPASMRAFAIASRARHTLVAHNVTTLTDRLHGGVLVTGHHSVIEHNRITSTAPFNPAFVDIPLGIVVTGNGFGPGIQIQHCVVRENMMRGLLGAITVGAFEDEAARWIEVAANYMEGLDGAVEVLASEVKDDLDPVAFTGSIAPALLRGYGIALAGAHDSRAVGNHIVITPIALALFECESCSVSANHINRSFAAITTLSDLRVEIDNNVITEPHVWGILSYLGRTDTLISNEIDRAFGPSIFCLGGRDVEVAENQVQRGGYGILLFMERRALVRTNHVNDMRRTGIAAVGGTDGVRITGNHVSNCGFQGGPFIVQIPIFGAIVTLNLTFAVGISVMYYVGKNEIDNCEVTGTGDSATAGAGSFAGLRFSVFVHQAAFLRLHDCTVIAPIGENVNTASINALLHTWAPFIVFDTEASCDVMDNLMEGRSQTILACFTLGAEILMADNRVRNIMPRSNDPSAAVELVGSNISVTGNRVRSLGPALRVSALRLTAVGNITSIPPSIGLTFGPEVPLYATANLIA